MGKPYVVYGQKGTGSVPVEAALLLLGEPYEVVDRPTDEVMARVSPLLGSGPGPAERRGDDR